MPASRAFGRSNDPIDGLVRRQLAIWLEDRPLAVHPARLDPVQPGRLDRQIAGDDPGQDRVRLTGAAEQGTSKGSLM